MRLVLAAFCASLLLLGGCTGDPEPEVTDAVVESASTAASPVAADDPAAEPAEGPDGPTGEPDPLGQVVQRGEIVFGADETGARFSGSVAGYDGDSWTFEAKGGQLVDLGMTSENQSLQAAITGPEGSSLLATGPATRHERVELPADGVYTISVLLASAEARRGTSVGYEGTLVISPL